MASASPSLSSQWLSSATTAPPSNTNATLNSDSDSEEESFYGDDEDISLAQLGSLLVPILVPLVARAVGRYAQPHHPFSTPPRLPFRKRKTPTTSSFSSHLSVSDAIAFAVENGDPNLDLSYRNLHSIPPQIYDLKHTVSINKQHPHDALSNDSIFLDPNATSTSSSKAKLFLSMNRIQVLDLRLFEVVNLTVLSLRNNAITHLPRQIRLLSNLIELSIGGNLLTYLPAELCGCMHPGLKVFAFPNPFLEVPGGSEGEGDGGMGGMGGGMGGMRGGMGGEVVEVVEVQRVEMVGEGIGADGGIAEVERDALVPEQVLETATACGVQGWRFTNVLQQECRIVSNASMFTKPLESTIGTTALQPHSFSPRTLMDSCLTTILTSPFLLKRVKTRTSGVPARLVEWVKEAEPSFCGGVTLNPKNSEPTGCGIKFCDASVTALVWGSFGTSRVPEGGGGGGGEQDVGGAEASVVPFEWR
ncbi:hypothetical protein HDU98_003751 [Podochytrium sp. JEL0797]|nr:hypothetical protein HDU98_003751 [Podochytrium sp. JEL0797]